MDITGEQRFVNLLLCYYIQRERENMYVYSQVKPEATPAEDIPS